jgi:cyanophycin synthetase
VGARRLESSDAAHWAAGQRLLINRNVEAAVFENDPLSLLTEGLAYDRCWVGIVTDSLALPALDEHLMITPEHRYKILRTQVDVVLESGCAVLNATDDTVLSMAELSDGDVILYAADGQHPAVQAQRLAGKRVVYFSQQSIVRASGNQVIGSIDCETELSPAAQELPGDVLLAAVAAAWALGLEPQVSQTGLSSYGTVDSQTLVIS